MTRYNLRSSVIHVKFSDKHKTFEPLEYDRSQIDCAHYRYKLQRQHIINQCRAGLISKDEALRLLENALRVRKSCESAVECEEN